MSDAKAEARRIILDEHRSISAVLSGLKDLARLAQDPKLKPGFDALRAMIYYIDAFPERMHHPKEDRFLFAKLLERDPSARALVELLQSEHVQGASLVRDLEQSLLQFEALWPNGAAAFAAAVERYARFHWDHMRREEHQVLPMCEAALTAEDWAVIRAAFAGNEDPIADLRQSDFASLYQRILRLAPAPVGVGASWRQDGRPG
ncbi:MAG: hemerythrin domain-containing protein [Betaproteobacteria bacterium]